MSEQRNRVFLKDHYPDLVKEIRDKHGANIDLIFFDPDDINIPRLVRGMFEIGYVTGQVHAAKGEWLPDVGTQAEIVTQNDTSAKSEEA